jgi:hypothetical protein
MGLTDFLRSQFIEIIEWNDDSRDTLSFRYPDDDKEIKNGAQLIVRESQSVQFVYLGQYGDLFGPGKHTLTTDNIPILTNLKSWKYALESPFKADVYYVVTRVFTGNKWGTANPVMMRDTDFGVVSSNFGANATVGIKNLNSINNNFTQIAFNAGPNAPVINNFQSQHAVRLSSNPITLPLGFGGSDAAGYGAFSADSGTIIGHQQPMFKIEVPPVPRRSVDGLLNARSVVWMSSLEYELHCRLIGSVAFKDAIGFLRPVEFPARNIPTETARVAQPLCFRQIGFAAA